MTVEINNYYSNFTLDGNKIYWWLLPAVVGIMYKVYHTIVSCIHYKGAVNDALESLQPFDIRLLLQILPVYYFENNAKDAELQCYLKNGLLLTLIEKYIRINFDFSRKQHYVSCDKKFYLLLKKRIKTHTEVEDIAKQLTSGKPLERTERARLNSRLNEIQMRDAGVEFFEWSTANDERVSKGPTGHKRLERKIYRWDDPEHYPVIGADGTRGTPGQQPGCRCDALPVILQKDYKVKAIQDKDGSIHYKIIRGRL